MNQLSPSARRLFELARGQDDPDLVAQARVSRALSVRLLGEVSLAAAGSSVALSATAWGALAAKSGLVAGVTGTLVAAGWLATRALYPAAMPAERSNRPAPAVHAPARAQAADTPPLGLPEPSAPKATRESPKTVSHPKQARLPVQAEPPASPPPAAEDKLRAETVALRQAQEALRDMMPERALRLLDDQDLRFRDGLLHQERAAARVLALCQAGQIEQARAQALRFERTWPNSALLGRVRSACQVP